MIRRLLSEYGMLGVLFALCAFLSVWTINLQSPSGQAAGEQVADAIIATTAVNAHVLVIARDTDDDRAFSAAVTERVNASGRHVVQAVHGEPRDGVKALHDIALTGLKIDAIAVTRETGEWSIFRDEILNAGCNESSLARIRILFPSGSHIRRPEQRNS